jgi:glyoxylase-like metal-dependent hydrolase (beta-lactamase superfamily II)
MARGSTITRLFMGDFLGPPETEIAGRRIVVTAFLVRHPEALILVDTGIAPTLPAKDEATYRFHRRPIVEALAAESVAPADVDVVINCHLHADHAGGNDRFRGTPILVRAAELEIARRPDYTSLEATDLDGGAYQVIEGDHQVASGVVAWHTPGHTPGHQAVIVDTADGPVVLGGQGFRTSSDYAQTLRALQLRRMGEPAPDVPSWVERVVDLDPWRVIFAHDLAIWQRGA